ncbi:MAG: hypothetical protein U0793_20995 [Gemmataceae bacterium]
MSNPLSFWAVACLGCLAAAGCGSRGVSMTGKVTYKGDPVTGGFLTFAPQDVSDKGTAAGAPVSVAIHDDGSFTASPAVSHCRVYYSPPVAEVTKELKPGEGPPASPYDGLVPKPDEVDIKAGSNTLDVELIRPGK